MDKHWKRQAIAAMAALVMIFGAAGAYSASVLARNDNRAKAEEPQPPFTAAWATIAQTAATHEGPGLRYPMTGSISAGHAVEVIRQQDGWCKCMTYMSAEPVWICTEYLDFAE